jgi:hypothetical protein
MIKYGPRSPHYKRVVDVAEELDKIADAEAVLALGGSSTRRG